MRNFILAGFIAMLSISNAFAVSEFKNTGIHIREYVYSYADDGGTAGTFVLSSKANASVIPVGAIVTHVTAKVLTQPVSTASATIEWGNGNDSDGYSGTAIAKATLAANYVVNEAQGAGALLWDNTNDANIPLLVTDATSGNFKMTLNVGNLTAGKILFLVEYYYPSL